jgi:FAD/FMN-containing dehydrogenase
MRARSQLSRRALLAGTAASLALPSLPRSSRAQPAISAAAWRELERCIPGGVFQPNDPRFIRLTQPENLRYFNPPANPGDPPDPDAPFVVVRPRTSKEVACAIRWARDNNMPMVPRSGGHSYAGCSTVPGIVINASLLQGVRVQDGVVEAGGGALFGDMLAALRNIKAGSETGRYTITHGRCKGVGLSAYLMGGGWALDSPHAGMGCDRVAKVEMVLADGRIVIASETEDPEGLFWAVRGGGGGNLGFATKWWLEPIQVENVTVFNANWRLSDNAHAVFHTLLRALDAAPDRMGGELTVSATSTTIRSPWRYQIHLACQLHGSRDEFDTLMRRAIAEADAAERSVCSFNDCWSSDFQELPYWDAQEFFEEVSLPNRYQETSLFAREIPDSVIDLLFGIWPSWPGNTVGARVTVYRTGGKVNAVPADATAFVHRASKWMLTTDIDWSGGDSAQVVATNLRWQRAVHNAFADLLGKPGSYYNFPDPGLPDHARAYWGSNFERLVAIKRQVDPNSVFTPPRNQGIVP